MLHVLSIWVQWCSMLKHETLPTANVQTWFRTAEEMKALLMHVRNPHEIMIFWVHLHTFPFCNYWDSSDLTCKTWGCVCFLLSSSGHYRFITNNLGLSCGEFWCSCFARHMDLGSDNLSTLDLGRGQYPWSEGYGDYEMAHETMAMPPVWLYCNQHHGMGYVFFYSSQNLQRRRWV